MSRGCRAAGSVRQSSADGGSVADAADGLRRTRKSDWQRMPGVLPVGTIPGDDAAAAGAVRSHPLPDDCTRPRSSARTLRCGLPVVGFGQSAPAPFGSQLGLGAVWANELPWAGIRSRRPCR